MRTDQGEGIRRAADGLLDLDADFGVAFGGGMTLGIEMQNIGRSSVEGEHYSLHLRIRPEFVRHGTTQRYARSSHHEDRRRIPWIGLAAFFIWSLSRDTLIFGASMGRHGESMKPASPQEKSHITRCLQGRRSWMTDGVVRHYI